MIQRRSFRTQLAALIATGTVCALMLGIPDAQALTQTVDNGLTNSGFEEGEAGWAVGPKTTFSVDQDAGRDSGAGAVLHTKSRKDEVYLEDTQDAAQGLRPGDTIRATAFVRSEGTGVTARLMLRFYTGGRFERTESRSINADAQWRQISVSADATAPDTHVSVRVAFSSATSKTRAFVDDVTLGTTRTFADEPAPPSSRVLLRFDSSRPDTAFYANAGNAAVTTLAESLEGGVIQATQGATGEVGAARFPGYGSGGFAVVKVANASSTDALDAGTRSFEFGAEFALDAVSSGANPDNGDNLIQRGLYGDVSQWKMQLDDGVPSCRVKGDQGAVEVRAGAAVQREHWYSASCRRDGSTVTLTLVDLATGQSRSWSGTGATGSVKPAADTVPLAVGGKLSSAGLVAAWATDQFNGTVDNAYLDID